MTNISSTAAPAAGQDLVAAPGRRAGVDRGWQLEMERAQARQWFHGAIGQGSAPRPEIRVQQPAGAQLLQAPVQDDAPHARATGAAAATGETGETPASAPHHAAGSRVLTARSVAAVPELAWGSALQAIPRGVPLHDQAVQPGQRLAAAANTPTVPAGLQPQPMPVSLHVEEGPAGLRVWLGVAGDAAEAAARAQSVLQELRRECARTGQRLALVVCNGEPLFEQAADGGSGRPADVSLSIQP